MEADDLLDILTVTKMLAVIQSVWETPFLYVSHQCKCVMLRSYVDDLFDQLIPANPEYTEADPHKFQCKDL